MAIFTPVGVPVLLDAAILYKQMRQVILQVSIYVGIRF